MSEHAHAVNAVVTGLSALPGTAQAFAATRAMSRFLNHEGIALHALVEPAQDAVRSALVGRPGGFVLAIHDWCMFNFNGHRSKRDRYVRSHATDLGYERLSGNKNGRWPMVYVNSARPNAMRTPRIGPGSPLPSVIVHCS